MGKVGESNEEKDEREPGKSTDAVEKGRFRRKREEQHEVTDRARGWHRCR